MSLSRSGRFIFFTIFLLLSGFAYRAEANLIQDQAQPASVAPKLTEEEIKQFLLKARVKDFKQSNVGVTAPWTLTLTDGKITHKASYQSIDEFHASMALDNGKTEINFRDSWHFNIAAYELSKLLGLGDMMPVTVKRKWGRDKVDDGSVSWWLDNQMNERQRIERNIQPPDPEAWSRQFDTMMVFSELVYDTDRNRTNVLIGPNWELYMIDFTRAFRLHKDLFDEKNLKRCSRPLLEKLRQLDAEEVARVTKPHLSKDEIKNLMARRDKIVAFFEKQIAQKGEKEILF